MLLVVWLLQYRTFFSNLISLLFQDVSNLTPLSPEVISRQATINIGTIGHVAHGKSTVVKAISGVQTVRFKNELERNITIKLGKHLCYEYAFIINFRFWINKILAIDERVKFRNM